jgi:hypothetical protein
MTTRRAWPAMRADLAAISSSLISNSFGLLLKFVAFLPDPCYICRSNISERRL